jgi:hypothetical protein
MHRWLSRSRGDFGRGWDAKYRGDPTMAGRRSGDTRTAIMSFSMNSIRWMPASKPPAMSQADNWFCFHLLSEGDASTLGKYNSHYSDDVLAHIIGEPIPGNCYMWSAPHQPFVLPVRVRSFEDANRKNISRDTQAEKPAKISAQVVVEALSGSKKRLSDGLLEALKQPNIRWVRIPAALPDGKEGIGIKSGQLYYVIKALKTAADTQSEEQLKRELLVVVLGEGGVHVKHHGGADYFCATQAAWEGVLGKKLSPSDPKSE